MDLLADPGFGQGGPQIFFLRICQCIKAEQAILAGVKGPKMDPGSSGIFNSQICILPLFPGTFSSNYLMCVGKLQNIYFNMKDSEHFGKCNFPFLYLRQSRDLFVHLLFFADITLCKPGVSGLLRAPEVVTFLYNCQICTLPLFLVLFLQKLNLHLCRHIHENIFFNTKLLGILTNLFLKSGLVCRYISL